MQTRSLEDPGMHAGMQRPVTTHQDHASEAGRLVRKANALPVARCRLSGDERQMQGLSTGKRASRLSAGAPGPAALLAGAALGFCGAGNAGGGGPAAAAPAPGIAAGGGSSAGGGPDKPLSYPQLKPLIFLANITNICVFACALLAKRQPDE